MGFELDISEAVSVVNRVAGSGARIGAAGALVLRKTAFDIEADGKMLVEAYDAVDTGDMMNSISTSFAGDGRSRGMTAEIGPTVEYAIYVHDGTSVMPGRPYMSDAFDRRYPGFESALAQAAAAEVL